MRKLFLAVLLVLAPAGPAAAFGSDEAGGSGATFLKLGADARAAGMANAVSASAEDATSVFWNPAGLALLRYRHVAVSHAAGYQSSFREFLAFAHPLEGPRSKNPRERELQPDQLGAVAVGVLYHNSGRLNEIDNTGTTTGRSFTPQDLAAMIGWGATIARGFDVGVTAKYVATQIQDTAATGAADLGARWRTQLYATEVDYALAVVVRNVGGKLKFHDSSDPLPMTIVVGQAVRPWKSMTLTADLIAPRDRPVYPSAGVEWRSPMSSGMSTSLRAGYDGRLKSSDFSGFKNVTVGGGIGFSRLSFDYAWAPGGELGDSQRLSLSYRF